MHIPEGMLPTAQAIGWTAASGVVLAHAVRVYRNVEKKLPQLLPLMGILGAAVFVLSMLHIPVPFTGTSAHMVGVPLATLLVGPWLSTILALAVLLLQALLLGEGGLSTLGANVFAMGVAGSFTTYYVFLAAKRLRMGRPTAIILAALAGDLAVYVVSALQLAPVLPGEAIFTRFVILLFALMPLQLPVAFLEGFITLGIFNLVVQNRPTLMDELQQAMVEEHA